MRALEPERVIEYASGLPVIAEVKTDAPVGADHNWLLIHDVLRRAVVRIAEPTLRDRRLIEVEIMLGVMPEHVPHPSLDDGDALGNAREIVLRQQGRRCPYEFVRVHDDLPRERRRLGKQRVDLVRLDPVVHASRELEVDDAHVARSFEALAGAVAGTRDDREDLVGPRVVLNEQARQRLLVIEKANDLNVGHGSSSETRALVATIPP